MDKNSSVLGLQKASLLSQISSKTDDLWNKPQDGNGRFKESPWLILGIKHPEWLSFHCFSMELFIHDIVSYINSYALIFYSYHTY